MIVSLACAGLAACAAPSSGEVTLQETAESADELKAKPNDLTAKQEKLVLQLINDGCGDSWCEGDHDYRFTGMKCSFASKSCTMALEIIDPKIDAKTPERDFFRSCRMTNVSGFTSMIDTAANGYQSLGQDFYGKVDGCVTRLEGSIPAR